MLWMLLAAALAADLPAADGCVGAPLSLGARTWLGSTVLAIEDRDGFALTAGQFAERVGDAHATQRMVRGQRLDLGLAGLAWGLNLTLDAAHLGLTAREALGMVGVLDRWSPPTPVRVGLLVGQGVTLAIAIPAAMRADRRGRVHAWYGPAEASVWIDTSGCGVAP